MSRCIPIMKTVAIEPAWTSTRLRSGGRGRLRRRPIPTAALALLVAFLPFLGTAHGWARQDSHKQARQTDPKQAQQDGHKQARQTDPKQAQQDSQKQARQDDHKPARQDDHKQAPQDDPRQMRGLDEQIQEIKSDVLSISAELSQLEEKLLYPSGTQVAIFVAVAKGDPMRLDSVRLKIDGEPVADYIYSFKELEALRKGGVQRIYVGNVATGDHQLEVAVDGKAEGGQDFSRTEHFTFRKEVKPKLVGLTLAGPNSGDTPIALGEW
jgi:hypothetical protein